MAGPDVTKIKGKAEGVWDSIVGFLGGDDHPIETGAIGGVIDKLMGDSWVSSALGGLAAGRIEKAGLPAWAALLGGVAIGGLAQDHKILAGLLTAFAPVIMGVAVKLGEQFHLGDKLEKMTGLNAKDLIPTF